MPDIELTEVESSNIAAIGYDRRVQTLRIKFNNGSIYDYPTMPERTYQDFAKAESKGKFFHRIIKPNFAHRRMADPTVPAVPPLASPEAAQPVRKAAKPAIKAKAEKPAIKNVAVPADDGMGGNNEGGA